MAVSPSAAGLASQFCGASPYFVCNRFVNRAHPRASAPRICCTAQRPLSLPDVVSIRAALPSDLPALVALEDSAWPLGNWSEDQVAEELHRCEGLASVVVAEVKGSPAGWAVGWHVPPDELQILEVAVSPAHRCQGVATALLQHLITERQGHTALVTLEVRVSSAAAIRLYAKAGFVAVGRRRGYYKDGEDALLMNLELRPPA